MSIQPSVRLIAEVSGDLIGHLPRSAGHLKEDAEVDYGEAGQTPVTYKVEKVRYVAEYTNTGHPEALDRYSVYGRTDLIVSVVP